MPTIHTQPGSVVFGAGKNLGQIAAEREQYTRGAEQARMDLQKQRIKNAQTERALARIDADEKETRRQQEWDAIAKRAKEAAEESKRRWEEEQERKGEMTDYQKQIIEAKKRAEQERIDKINRDKAWLKKIQEGQNVGGQVTQPTATTPTQQPAPQQQGIMGLLAQKQDEWKGVPYRRPEQAPAQPEIKKGYTPPSDIADYIDVGSKDILESMHKDIKPLTQESRAKLRQKANIEAYGRGGTDTQKKINAMSIFNKSIEKQKKENKVALDKVHIAENEIRTAMKPKEITTAESSYVENVLYGDRGIIEDDGERRTNEGIKAEWNKRKNTIPKKLRAIIEQRIKQETEDEVSAEIDKLLGM